MISDNVYNFPLLLHLIQAQSRTKPKHVRRTEQEWDGEDMKTRGSKVCFPPVSDYKALLTGGLQVWLLKKHRGGEAQWEVLGRSCWKHDQEVSPAQEKDMGCFCLPGDGLCQPGPEKGVNQMEMPISSIFKITKRCRTELRLIRRKQWPRWEPPEKCDHFFNVC